MRARVPAFLQRNVALQLLVAHIQVPAIVILKPSSVSLGTQVTRQKIPKDWHKRLQVIQAKAAEAVKELPPGTLSSLTDGADAPVDYMRAVEIRDKLASTSERTMFGGLQGPAATWDKIVKAYEKQCEQLGCW